LDSFCVKKTAKVDNKLQPVNALSTSGVISAKGMERIKCKRTYTFQARFYLRTLLIDPSLQNIFFANKMNLRVTIVSRDAVLCEKGGNN
jgi:hypothetical protein